MKNQKTAIIFIGIQASGKTTFYERNFSSLIHINLDTLHTRKKEDQLLEECIKREQSFVVDNTNPTKENRKKYIYIAKASGYCVKGYYFRSSVIESLERNSFRSGKSKVPDCAIFATQSKLELPDYNEGFDELYYVCIKNGVYIVSKWDEQQEGKKL